MTRITPRAPGRRRKRGAAAGLAVCMALSVAPSASAARNGDYRQVVDLTFPVAGKVRFSDDYKAGRSGGHRHQATDIFAPKETPVHAAVSGVICWLPGVDEPMPHYGYTIGLCGDDGRQYNYLHLNNDRPGTDDGRGDSAGAYAPGIRKNGRVRRGQLLGFVGDSGNAERTPSHLHFEIVDEQLRDPRLDPSPWRQGRINPYPGLIAAQRRNDVPGTTARLLRLVSPYQRGHDVRAFQRGLATLGLHNSRGQPLSVDGVFGRETDAVARRFQAQVGLDPIGVVGPKTLGALARALADKQSSRSRPSTSSAWPGRYLKLTDPLLRGNDVKVFQTRLGELGYRNSRGRPIVGDGIWGPETDRAARAFIADAGLPPIPIVGPNTWGKAFGG